MIFLEIFPQKQNLQAEESIISIKIDDRYTFFHDEIVINEYKPWDPIHSGTVIQSAMFADACSIYVSATAWASFT